MNSLHITELEEQNIVVVFLQIVKRILILIFMPVISFFMMKIDKQEIQIIWDQCEYICRFNKQMKKHKSVKQIEPTISFCRFQKWRCIWSTSMKWKNKAFVGLGSCDKDQTERKIFEYANWSRLQINRTGPSSWAN